MVFSSAFTGKTIIAHRGASGYETENTLEAFEKAVEMNVEMIEFDVQKTDDKKLIVLHDEKVRDKKVEEMDYHEIEEKIEYHIPLLEEVLKLLKDRTKIDVDLKKTGYEDETINLILRYFDKSDFIISSRDEESLQKIKQEYNLTTAIILGSTKSEKIKLFFGIFPEEKVKESNADYIAVNSWWVSKRILGGAERLGKPVFVWNVNKESSLIKNPVIKGLIVKNPENYS